MPAIETSLLALVLFLRGRLVFLFLFLLVLIRADGFQVAPVLRAIFSATGFVLGGLALSENLRANSTNQGASDPTREQPQQPTANASSQRGTAQADTNRAA